LAFPPLFLRGRSDRDCRPGRLAGDALDAGDDPVVALLAGGAPSVAATGAAGGLRAMVGPATRGEIAGAGQEGCYAQSQFWCNLEHVLQYSRTTESVQARR